MDSTLSWTMTTQQSTNVTRGDVYQPFPQGFCPDALWDPAVSWNTEDPDLTVCFQLTVLTWIPCFFLWITIPLQAYRILYSHYKIRKWTWVSLTKTVLTTTLIILTLIELFNIVDSWRTSQSLNGVSDAELINLLLRLATFVRSQVWFSITSILKPALLKLVAGGFIYTDRIRARPSSGILCVFWSLMLIEGAITLNTRTKHATKDGIYEDLRFIINMISFPVIVAQFVLSCVAEHFHILVDDVPNPSPEPLASLPSRSVFEWFSPMAYRGWKRPLEQKDLWNLVIQDRTKTSVEYFQTLWNREFKTMKKTTHDFSTPEASSHRHKPYHPSLTKTLFRTFWKPLLASFILRLFSDILIFVPPQILRWLIQFIENGSEESWKGYFYAGLMLLSSTVQTFALNHYFFITSRFGLRIRAAIMAAVYRKALHITSAAKRSSNLGEIVNLMSVDAQRLNDLMTYLNLIWSGPFMILLTIYFLYEVLGQSVFAGLAVLLLFAPISASLANRNKKTQLAQMKHKDARIKLITEILSGMKVLKLYAWEESFEKKMLAVRELELRQLRRAANLEAISAFNWFVLPFLVSYVTFATYVLSSTENVLDAQKAFVALSLLNVMRNPLTMLPHAITLLVQSNVSVKRLTKFLCNEELEPGNVRTIPENEGSCAVVVSNGSFSWGEDEPVCLRNVNLAIHQGDLVAIVGQVGSGKSSLVAAMLGLMDKLSGDVGLKGSVAYVPQQAWIQNLTLKENILFGKPLDQARYEMVLEACALKTDLLILPAGDQTEIGEKGTNLSGGQRQRVSLARAVYADVDVYVLDDPLSAVDAHVGKHIFEHVIGPSGILKDKTRILVTHGIGYLPQADLIVVLDQGLISEVGDYEQLLHNNGAFAEFLRTYVFEEDETLEAIDAGSAAVKHAIIEEIGLKIPKEQCRERTTSDNSHTSLQSQLKIREIFRQESRLSNRKITDNLDEKSASVLQLSGDFCEEKDDEGRKLGQLVSEEFSEHGKVKWRVYNTYLKHATYKAAISMAVCYVIFNILNISGSFWLTAWTRDSEDPEKRNNTYWRDYRLSIYGLFGGLQAMFILASYLILAYGLVMASRNLHRGLLYRIMRAPMWFFDTTPLGRIVNRFTRDIEIVDSMIPINVESLIYCFLSVVFTLIVICISTPVFSAVILPLGIFYLLIQRFFIATSRQLKRLEAVSRSPIYSHFQESVTGSNVILTYDQTKRFILDNETRIDTNTVSYFLNIVSQRWVAIRMDIAGNFVTFFAALFAIISRDQNWGITPEDVGLSISYALSVTQVMNWMVRNASDMESNVISVERINEYSEIEMEAPWRIDNTRPDPNWPTDGQISFNNYQTRYRKELDLVLRGIDCQINSGDKVGIVGRTGAGKSSLTLALFRIIEATGGSISIDGINTAKLGLHDVRSRITILPQEPVLFSGSLRMNLDPFDKYSDAELWRALENSHLKQFVSALPDGLDHTVAEGGENMSVGQRQLICLARALLRKTKILILDEATAAIDLETDALIQETIRTEFADCTILTIAHRINTIMDSTKVMVLDQGIVKEFASPEELLANPRSLFYSLAKSANLA